MQVLTSVDVCSSVFNETKLIIAHEIQTPGYWGETETFQKLDGLIEQRD